MKRLRSTVAVVVTVSAMILLGVVVMSRSSSSTGNEDLGLLRLSWSLLPEPVEGCRTLTEEELAGRPTQMGQEEVCEATTVPYRLQVRINGRPLADEIVVGGGARGDPQVHVLREYAVNPGRHSISVSFAPEDTTLWERPRADAAPDERFAPRQLQWSGMVGFAAGQVGIVTYDADRRRLRYARQPQNP